MRHYHAYNPHGTGVGDIYPTGPEPARSVTGFTTQIIRRDHSASLGSRFGDNPWLKPRVDIIQATITVEWEAGTPPPAIVQTAIKELDL